VFEIVLKANFKFLKYHFTAED